MRTTLRPIGLAPLRMGLYTLFMIFMAASAGAAEEPGTKAPRKREAFRWGEMQFNLLRDVHTNAYAFDPVWIREWETKKYISNGLNFLHGSL